MSFPNQPLRRRFFRKVLRDPLRPAMVVWVVGLAASTPKMTRIQARIEIRIVMEASVPLRLAARYGRA
ncbi:MAG: hypothetical protein ACRDJ4_06285 [Actinomycetota bacterium]